MTQLSISLIIHLVLISSIFHVSSSSEPSLTSLSCSSTLTDNYSADCFEKEKEPIKIGYHDQKSPVLRIILIRHGESENNIQHEISREQYKKHRKSDPSLTTNGFKQAEETGKYLASGKNSILSCVDEIYVSPFRRTMLTARPITKHLQMNPIIWTDIYEVGGVHENMEGRGGMSKQEIMDEFPDYVIPEESTITENGWYDVTKGKESHESGKERIRNVYSELQNRAINATKDQKIILVVHGGFIAYFLQTAFEIKSVTRVFPSWNACISVLDIDVNGDPMLLFHNSVSHLSIVKTQSLGRC